MLGRNRTGSMVMAKISRKESTGKMGKTTFTLMGIPIMSFLLITTTAVAWNCGTGREMGGCGMCGWDSNSFSSYEVANLTENQSGKMIDLQKKHIEETSKLRSELAVIRIELNQLLGKAQPNMEEVMTKQKELSDLQSKLQQKCLTKKLEMRKILTEEQFSLLPDRFALHENFLPGQMSGYDPPQRQGFRLGRGRNWGHRGGCRKQCW